MTSDSFMKTFLIWVIILLVGHLLLYYTAGVLETFIVFLCPHAVLAACLISLVQYNMKREHKGHVKYIELSFILYLLSISIVSPYAVAFEFLRIEIGHVPSMSTVFLKGVSYAAKKSLYVFVGSYFLLALANILRKMKRNLP